MKTPDWFTEAEAGIRAADVPEDIAAAAIAGLHTWLARVPEDAPAIQALVSAGRFDTLVSSFHQTLPFGTAGRRGPVGVGPNRINRWTVATSVQGHVGWLRERFGDHPITTVIAYDVRAFHDTRQVYGTVPASLEGLSSRDLCEHAARVYAANGVTAWLLPRGTDTFTSTPELSFAIRHLGAQGGLNLSASHNPPDDNGVKVFDDRGAQLVPPHDQDLLDRVSTVRDVVLADWDDAIASGQIRFLTPQLHTAYVNTLAALAGDGPRSVEVLYTPLHGTGCVDEVLRAAGFSATRFAPQSKPDPFFSTVPLHIANPERPEALTLAREHAGMATLVLGTDPDADRLGAAVRHRGGWVHLSGNDLAVVLVDELLRRDWEKTPLVIRTEVTTSLVSRVAEQAGAAIVDDLLVGFKYIGHVLEVLETTGHWGAIEADDVAFAVGVEESNGMLVTDQIRDKDSAGAALIVTEAAARAAAAGLTLVDQIEALWVRCGYIRNQQVRKTYAGTTGAARRAAVLDRIRSTPPARFGGREVLQVVDHQDPSGRWGPILSPSDAASRNVIALKLASENDDDGARVILRPSGTEPKLKAYIEVQGRVGLDTIARSRVDTTLAALAAAVSSELR